MIRTTLLLAIVSTPSLAVAGPLDRIDVSVAAGGHVFSDNVELGVDDFMDEPGPSSSALFGGRFAFAVIPRLAGEAELVLIPTKDDVLGDTATVLGIRAHARFDLLTGKLRPFVVAGYGGHLIRGGSPQMDDDADQAYHWGGGVRYALGRRLDLRVDVRHLIVPDRTEGGATSDFEASAGVAFKFGGTKAPPKRVVIEAPAPARRRRLSRSRPSPATPTATASATMSTSAASSPRTATRSPTRTAAPIRTTTATRSSTPPTSARSSPRWRTAGRTRTAARTS